MDKLQWFKFSPSSWMMGRIQRCSEVAQARFMRLCCSYWNHGCEMHSEDAEFELGEDAFNELVKAKVIYTDDVYVFIRFLDDQYCDIENTSNKGKLYALKRWKPEEYNRVMGIAPDKEPSSNPLGTHKEPNAEEKREEEKREEERREEKRRAKAFTPPSMEDVKSYFKEKGYTEQSAIKAYEYYSVANWKDSKGNKVKNWKQKMQGVWFKDENKAQKTKNNNSHLFIS